MLNHKIRGQGRPIVLLHGLFGWADNLNGIARALSDRYRVISIDLPGHGESEACEPLTLPAMADSIRNTLAALAVEEFALVGHSLGGKVGMQLAGLEPRLTAMVVLDIAPVVYQQGHGAIFATAKAVSRQSLSSRVAADAVLGETIKEPGVRAFIAGNLQRNEAGHMTWRIDFERLERNYPYFLAEPEFVAQSSAAVQVIKGEESDYILPEHEAAFRSRFSTLEFRVVNGTGHWLHAEKPAVISGLISRFLDVHYSPDS